MLSEVVHPSPLMVLQAIPGALYFDESIALLLGIELHEVRESGAVVLEVCEHALEHAFEMRCRNAFQSESDHLLCESAPKDKRIVGALFRAEHRQDVRSMLPALEPSERFDKECASTLYKSRTPQIRRPALKGMKERAGERGKDHIPAPKT